MEAQKGSLSWENLRCDLHPWIREAIKSLGFPTMTPVQASTIPLLSGNKDVVVESVTGSGKTLSFAIPVLQKVSNRLYNVDEEGEQPDPVKRGHMLSIILSPTRELASQIQSVFTSVLEYLPEDVTPIKTQLLVGSLSTVREDLDRFLNDRPQILIATPGRMLDFLSSQYVKTNSVEIAILDEADKLLDFSFEKDVVNILKRLPKQRRTGLFSATISAAGNTIFRTGMNNPVKVAVKSKSSNGNSAPSSLHISYLMINPERKITTLIKILHEYRYKKCIVYFPTCTSVKYFYSVFHKLVNDEKEEEEFKFYSLHGQLATKPRLRTLSGFTEGDASISKHILMTTDVAARGIDVPDVDLVIQIDPPIDPDVFLHRCGRTGRANKVGRAIVMLNENSTEEDYIGFMDVKGVTMSQMEPPKLETTEHIKFQNKLRNFMLDDRSRHEIAIKSYVGFVRYYTKHMASSIFRYQSLDYLGIARMYGLLRLPKMPEAKFIPKEDMPEDAWLGEPINMDNYAYADKQKEKSRLDNLEAEKQKKISDAKRRKELKVKNEAWSSKVETKETRQERREKMKRKRDAIEKQIMEESSEDEETEVDWKDIVKSNKKAKSSSSGMQGSFDDL
ncbi:ATP-dependent rRNA helicase SPB4 [Scheffersomyces xylosifermentans]|uniref:ATP-dependent rRNA helicase SPB4 n=1 Tax=Scheffersomyces xylosifermentans TaxID=1304137 RepID=UPI00315C83E0